MNALRRSAAVIMAAAAILLPAAIAVACPTCTDSLAHDPASENLVRGYAYSIIFMLSMPPLIFGGLSAYFYWEVRKAKARQAADGRPPELVSWS
jgi:hypothetical protein